MPAHQLKGLTLDNGWTVLDKTSNPKGTGGHFSVCYEVVHANGERAFLKALDYSSAFQSADPARELQNLTALFNFERDVLEKCKGHKLSRVVVPLDSGKVSVMSAGPQTVVEYIIFQRAIGDLRNTDVEKNILDVVWSLRALHQAAVGLQQLHSKEIIHQDLKPSNILYFDKLGIKVSDLGTSFDTKLFSPRAAFAIAGAVAYAPLDRKYDRNTPTYQQRVATDIYLLGSLFFFFFTGVAATQSIITKLQTMNLLSSLSGRDFAHDLPFIETAFNEAVRDLGVEITKKAPTVSEDIKQLVTSMCEPDPNKRGIKSQIKKGGNPFDMYRYVSMIDRIAIKAEIQLK